MWRRRSSTLAKRITLGEEVKEALYGARKPIVALESTIIAHGMPYPQNFQMATHVEDLIRQQGACPATICIAHGHLKVGLSQKELKHLAEMGPHVKKCSTRDIPVAIAEKIVGATTVSSTMRIAHATGIQVFVTGGIGGVHRFSEETMDISTDLMELSRTPVAVICAGVKSILDIPRTLEYLETHAVPVIGYKTGQFPAFFTQDSGLPAQVRADSPRQIAEIIQESTNLNLPSGFVIAVPNPNPVPTDIIDNAIKQGLDEVHDKQISGQAVTPYLLKRLNEITGGVSLGSNIDLVNNNAIVGSNIAKALFDLQNEEDCKKSLSSITDLTGIGKKKIEENKKVLVVGGLVLDIISTASAPIIPATSNIGEIRQTSGGVGRNIAECLHRLEVEPLLVSSVGNDSSGSVLLDQLKHLGMTTSGIQIHPEAPTAVYSAVLCPAGDLDVAIADMRAFDSIDTSAIDSDSISKSRMVVADGNLSPKALKELFQRCEELKVPVFFEPTSVPKAGRVVEANAVQHLTFTSPNADELHAISASILKHSSAHARQKLYDKFPLDQKALESNLPQEKIIQIRNDILTVLWEMVQSEASSQEEKHVILTMGKHGVVVGSINNTASVNTDGFHFNSWGAHRINGHTISMAHLPGKVINVKNCTGAGDSLVGGIVYGLLEGKTIFESCHMGMIAARRSLSSDHAINPDLCPQDLLSESS